ncbi:ABC-2 type transport system permease protein [Lentzea xinjiangensis]|uniref:ABC-2 type transport system permease protein n=1 Tax=Lentzea xinjiangensis TaxID=402600 RepID=A0A1H9W8H9_9PSEU|nr:ABC transporter permease [Lentzea xinjiangensis]SES30091.1 ABC-2 type transport system permease protein [Lentzea xinjiangensis]
MIDAVATEVLKTRRSRVPWVTAATFAVATAVGGLFMFILQDQDRARSLGLIGTKAALVGGQADWPTYLSLLSQIAALGGMLVFGLVSVWLFGREFSQNTVKDLLAMPTSRTSIVAAKFVVALMWCLALTFQLLVLGLLAGVVLGLPGWSAEVLGSGALVVVVTAGMTFLLTTPVALASSVGRGYLPGVAVMIGSVFCAQIVAALGYGAYFPWSVPALFSGVAGPDQASPGLLGVVLVVPVGAAGVVATSLWWRNADQDR